MTAARAYGKDSYLVFDPPADGEYTVRASATCAVWAANSIAYRLTLRRPRPDFRLAINPRNPNVPAGGAIPLSVTAQRLDGFDDPIEVTLEDLPPGFQATGALIGKGQVNGTILLSAAAEAKLDSAAPLKAIGRAGTLAHPASPEDATKLIALAPPPDIKMLTQTREVTLEAGATAEVLVGVLRQNGFDGRVPVEVRNLPPRVLVRDVGLNGVLLNEDETKRSFILEALPSAAPVEQLIYVSGFIETRSPQANSYASEVPVLLKIKSR